MKNLPRFLFCEGFGDEPEDEWLGTGNRLTSLTENVSSTLAGDVYSRGNVATSSYTYDKNGNMTNDNRRALNFGYNVLNLLSEVKTVGGELKAKYDYLADGTKLR